MTGRVIVLNGAGSVGKSSVARRMQAMAAAPLLHAEMDRFLDMLPERLWDDPAGLRFETLSADPPVTAVHSGPVIGTLMAAFRRSVADLAGAGANLVVDDVFWGDEAADYRRLLEGHDLRFVLLTARLDLLEAREKARGDRALGLARWEAPLVERAARWDLTVDASDATPDDCARRIIDAFGL